MGIIGTIVLGIVGALIGGWAAGAIFEDTAGVDLDRVGRGRRAVGGPLACRRREPRAQLTSIRERQEARAPGSGPFRLSGPAQ